MQKSHSGQLLAIHAAIMVAWVACRTPSTSQDGGSAPDGAVSLDAGSTSVGGGDAGLPVLLATEILGVPHGDSISVSVIPASDADVYFEYGTSPGTYTGRTMGTMDPGGTPSADLIRGLQPDTRYFYRTRWRAPGGGEYAAGPERTFHTARPRGQSFVFTIQADPHLDENSNLDLYRRALANELSDSPDMVVDLGDTFMCEKHSVPLDATVQAAPDNATVVARYLYERGNFGLLAHSAALFLVNGNHEGEAGWFLNGSANNLAVWTSLARKSYFPTPEPDGFYSGGNVVEPYVGKRTSWYAWEWGDALFVVLDPFWYTTSRNKADGWVWTLGREQYDWLQTTLHNSSAPFKFVFIHHLVGALDTQGRGGIEAAPFYEWGGSNDDGTPGFDIHRAGWGKPIHQIMVDNHVTALFHGHDHVYVKQQLDGIVYQEVPQPSAPNFVSGPMLAAQYHLSLIHI